MRCKQRLSRILLWIRMYHDMVFLALRESRDPRVTYVNISSIYHMICSQYSFTILILMMTAESQLYKENQIWVKEAACSSQATCEGTVCAYYFRRRQCCGGLFDPWSNGKIWIFIPASCFAITEDAECRMPDLVSFGRSFGLLNTYLEWRPYS